MTKETNFNFIGGCKICMYSRVINPTRFCFFNPPSIQILPNSMGTGLTIQSVRPAVKDDEFCSFYKWNLNTDKS